MRIFWFIVVGLGLAGGGFVGGMQFQRWRAEPPEVRPSGASAIPAAYPAPRATAMLVVETRPVVAVIVRVDGKARSGKGPFVFSSLSAGRHEIVVEQTGYRRHTQDIDIAEGERREITITLRDELGLYYKDKLAFPTMRLEVYSDEIDGRIVGFFGRVENRGKRTVHKIQIRLRFLDAEGRPRHEEFVHPLLAGGPTGDKPLPPGGAREFALKAPRVPTELCCEHIDWAVTLVDLR